ncbi:uncharacterized protein LOC119164783 [Rhipicephalus microplus]|uniref:uncharacterized protein LOC119164783 n=1 Tax=Rhipicephalus microplus TaxID=6941 RepID=UPI003F6A5FC5
MAASVALTGKAASTATLCLVVLFALLSTPATCLDKKATSRLPENASSSSTLSWEHDKPASAAFNEEEDDASSPQALPIKEATTPLPPYKPFSGGARTPPWPCGRRHAGVRGHVPAVLVSRGLPSQRVLRLRSQQGRQLHQAGQAMSHQ